MSFSFLVLHPNIAFLSHPSKKLSKWSAFFINSVRNPLQFHHPRIRRRQLLRCVENINSEVRTPLSICPPSSRVSPFCHTAEPYGQGNTRLSHIKRRRLIMPLVALVQKITAHPQLRTLVWCSALPFSSPLLLAFRLRTSECLYKNPRT